MHLPSHLYFFAHFLIVAAMPAVSPSTEESPLNSYRASPFPGGPQFSMCRERERAEARGPSSETASAKPLNCYPGLESQISLGCLALRIQNKHTCSLKWPIPTLFLPPLV